MRKLSTKLWLLMLLLITITLLLLWFFQIEFLEKFYIKIQMNNIVKAGKELAERTSQGASQNEIEEVIDQLLIKYNARVEIRSRQGNIVYSNELGQMGMMGINKLGMIMRALNGETVIWETKHNRFTTSFLLSAVPIKKQETVEGVLLITAPIAPVKETAEILKQQLIIVTGFLVFISLFLTYFFSKAFTKPILEINKAAKEMAEGNLDITLSKHSEDELGTLSDTINNLAFKLKKIEQLRKEIIANVSHEFRTPLSLIRGYAETIKDITGEHRDKRNRQLDIIIEEAERLNNMVNDILDLSQIQSDNYTLNINVFDIKYTIESVVCRFEYVTENTGVRIVQETDEGQILVKGDEFRIQQVLYNIINNAFNHTPDNGVITIRARCIGENVKVEIQDSGEGMSKEELEHIWDRFYKGDRNARNSSKGIGLGLSIVKSILEAHNADFGVKSNIGEGSVFWFTLNKG